VHTKSIFFSAFLHSCFLFTALVPEFVGSIGAENKKEVTMNFLDSVRLRFFFSD
jgi:hypothetical protein